VNANGDRIGLLGGRAGVVEEGPDRLCHRVDERDGPAARDGCGRLSEPVGDVFLRAVVPQTDLVLVVEPVLAVFPLERVGVRSRHELVAPHLRRAVLAEDRARHAARQRRPDGD
jgi:hypothetical protein